ncbi:MAG: hypothetical protein AAF004_14265 [Pseudomonadota bacterium]
MDLGSYAIYGIVDVMSELENAWVKRRTTQLTEEGLAWSAAKMIALSELEKRHRRPAHFQPPASIGPRPQLRSI